MGRVLLIVILQGGGADSLRFANPTVACEAVERQFRGLQVFLYRFFRNADGRDERIRFRCLPPIITPEHTEQVIVPERIEYPFEDVPK